jgi:hypothetical protein
MAALAESEVRIGLEVRSSLETANRLVLANKGKRFDAADCVNAIQSSQAMFLALTMAKLFEMPRPKRGETHARRYNRSDAASIPLFVRLIRQKRTRAHFAKMAEKWTPMLRSSKAKNARDCSNAIDRAVAVYDALRRSAAGRAAMLRLRSFRNNRLAHSLLISSRRVRSRYGEIFLLVDAARDIMGHAILAIEGRHADLADYEERKMLQAKAFWEAALPAAMGTQK